MEPWYKTVTPRKEVRDGRSFNPDDFAIALEQVVNKKAPEDYRDPKQFFSRTCWTRALLTHAGMVLRRLNGKTENTAPVLTLVTQFGGGKTHTLASLYHLAKNGKKAVNFDGVPELMQEAKLGTVPQAEVAVFVGNAWDPEDGTETPWIDIARQLARDKGVALLGKEAKSTPPGTATLAKVFEAADGPILILCDEVLNFVNRHRKMAEPFHAFIQNLTVAMTGTTRGAALISLPRSQVEMTEWDSQWQDKITKVVKRVAKDLIANDETEISEVVRRRLFEDLGNDKVRKAVAKAYADWCFERRAQLPPEWTAVDTAATEAKAKEFLRQRFETCYPFHPATLSVFQRKWQTLAQYQQTRGTLAMLAQWISWAYRDGFQQARREPLITIGSAPLQVSEFRGTVLGQLGEPRLAAAIDTDIAGANSHCKALDSDTKGPLRDIHRRVGAAILFESSGGQVNKVAHLPELRFAIGEPEVETTSIDNAAHALESRAFFISRVGSDGFRIYHKATIRKAVGDRRASLDEESEVLPAMRKLVEGEFKRGASVPVIFPPDGNDVPDSPRLSIAVVDPETEWSGKAIREQIAEWTKRRNKSDRQYPAALLWALKKPGRDLREKVELWLAWKRVAKEVADGTLGADYDKTDRAEIAAKVQTAEDDAKDEVWGSYRFVVLADSQEADGLNVIDLGAGHASSNETLCGRIITALKSQELLNESIGAGYIDRKWPKALKESGAWPLSGLRQCFLNGSFTRLLDPDSTLRHKITEFVTKGEFGLASGPKPDGTYDRVWFEELLSPDEVMFDGNVFLLTKARAKAFKAGAPPPAVITPETGTESRPSGSDVAGTEPGEPSTETDGKEKPKAAQPIMLRITGDIPPEIWNRLGTKVLPKLKSGTELKVAVSFTASFAPNTVDGLESDLQQILSELGLSGKVLVEKV
ncbi:MAG: AAA family ATPase [Verrucomicrobia bacterium]|nr:MAG: AAA family ATPase [Verrucomicrobiota bacterium]